MSQLPIDWNGADAQKPSKPSIQRGLLLHALSTLHRDFQVGRAFENLLRLAKSDRGRNVQSVEEARRIVRGQKQEYLTRIGARADLNSPIHEETLRRYDEMDQLLADRHEHLRVEMDLKRQERGRRQ